MQMEDRVTIKEFIEKSSKIELMKLLDDLDEEFKFIKEIIVIKISLM